ncbi:hypothetical protein M0805_003657 [Coniferiporia weirii]|nr:hypothetical protein M0805_003657 [Coniferiporia weirii]
MANPTRTYEIMKGFFIQDNGFDNDVAIPPRFGLIDSCADRWKNLLDKLKELNNSAPDGVAYKLIIAGRHGQGFHNLAELKYGDKPWFERWGLIDCDGEIVWAPDALLTDLGEDQAHDAQAMWKQEQAAANIPQPDKLYCSPMTRALRTCRITFDGVVDFNERRPLILENCREIYGKYPCDKRRTLTYIRTAFPEFAVEKSFTEKDELFDPEVQETVAHVRERARLVLDYIFQHDEEPFISITAHSYFIDGLVEATGHLPVELTTGGVLPMVVKCTTTQAN